MTIGTPGRATGPVSVVQVLGKMDRGGVELRAVALLARLDPQRFRLVFCVASGETGSLDETIRELGSEVYYCRLGVAFPIRLWRLLRTLRPDVAHSGVATFSGVVLTVARLVGVPKRVAHFYSSADRHGASLRGRVQRGVCRVLLDRSATHMLAVSEAAMDGLWRRTWRSDPRCRVLYNGVDVDVYARAVEVAATRPAAARPALVVHVARPAPLKNRDRAISVLAAARAAGVDVRLRLVGRQTEEETTALVARARALGVDQHVEFTGERLDVPDLLAEASLLLVTSRHEGLPSVVLEACAVGTPVLSSDLPGVREIARRLPGITVLPLSCDDATWADAVRRLTVTPPDPARRAAAHRSLSRSTFTLDCWQRELTAVWA